MAKTAAKKTTKKATTKKSSSKKVAKKSTKKAGSTDSIVVGLVKLVNKNVTKKEPAMIIVKLIFYACGRLILEQEGNQSLNQQVKYVVED